MKHITDVRPAVLSNFEVHCSCGYVSHIAGGLAFAEECAYDHVEVAARLDWFTLEELDYLTKLVGYADKYLSEDEEVSQILHKFTFAFWDKTDELWDKTEELSR